MNGHLFTRVVAGVATAATLTGMTVVGAAAASTADPAPAPANGQTLAALKAKCHTGRCRIGRRS